MARVPRVPEDTRGRGGARQKRTTREITAMTTSRFLAEPVGEEATTMVVAKSVPRALAATSITIVAAEARTEIEMIAPETTRSIVPEAIARKI